MTDEELNELETKTKFSGFDRQDSAIIILKLIRVIRDLKGN